MCRYVVRALHISCLSVSHILPANPKVPEFYLSILSHNLDKITIYHTTLYYMCVYENC